MNSTQMENNLIDAIQVLVDNAVDNADYDKTIQATIVTCLDKAIGQYKVKFQDSTFIAYAETGDLTYANGTDVWVLVPRNDMSLNKTILGAVSKLGVNYAQDTNIEDLYDIIGNNCIQSEHSFEFSSYVTTIKEIYNRDENINEIGLNTISVDNYLKQSSSIICGATFKTNLPTEQKFKGNYGIIFELDYKDNINGDITTKQYIIDVNRMTGEPYNLIKATRQYAIFDIDNQNFINIKRIYLFVKEFPHQAPDKPTDIFITNVELMGCNALSTDDLNGYFLSFVTPRGTYFDKTNDDTDTREIETQLKVKNQVVNPNASNMSYYWFVENVRVTATDRYYNPRGGEGWKCLNDYSIVQGTEKNPETVDWISATNKLIIAKKDVPAKETRYKCVVLYGDVEIAKEFSIINYDSQFDITIVSDSGTDFYFDEGCPTLDCQVKESGQPSISLKDFTFQWAEIDSYGNFTSLPETIDYNTEYNDAVFAYVTLDAEVKEGLKLKTTSQKKLDAYLTTIKKYDTITRIEQDKVFKIQIKNIVNFKTYKCSVYKNGIYIGTASIVLTNRLSLDEESNYSLILNNGTQVFKYNEWGIAPTNNSLDNPYIVPQLSFTIYDGSGNALSEEVLKNCDVQWIVPTDNTLLTIPDIYSDYLDFSSETENIYKRITRFNYDIANRYDISKVNNTIKLIVDYKGFNMVAETKLSFAKEGEPGTNGTEFLTRIVPNCDKSIAPLYPTITTYSNGTSSLNFNPDNADKWFKIELWHNGSQIFSGTNDGQSNEGKNVSRVTWSILKNKYNYSTEDQTNLEVSEDGEFNYSGYYEGGAHADIIKCELKYEGVSYVATLPLISVKLNDDSYDISLKDYSGFRFATYTSDGRRPQYDNSNPFELIVTKVIDDEIEDISTIEIPEYKLEYNWSILGAVYRFENSAAKIQNSIWIQETAADQPMQINQKWFKPIDNYTGECLTNALECAIVSENKGTIIGKIHIPIHLYLNRYGHAELNAWDGNSIQLNEDGGYILSPQIGAGKKEADNSFTGMLMGTVKEPNRITEDTGLLAYHKGIRTSFIDAETGTAIFGRKTYYQNDSGDNSNLGGQIIIDPSSTHAMIYSSKYWKNYQENGLPTSYSDTNKSGGHVKDSNNENHIDYVDEEYGMLIDLDDPKIEWGNKNFIVNREGHITARGGGSIAGWKIDDYKIYSNDKKTGINSVYKLGEQGSTEWQVKVPKTVYGTENDLRTIAYWAGGQGTNGKFHVTHDGYVRAQEMTVGSGSSSNLIYIGESNGNSAIYTLNKYSYNDNNNGFYLGTDGIGLGRNNFWVDNTGKLYSKFGTIGGWTISDKDLTNGNTGMRTGSGVAFWAGGNGENSPFYVMHDGSLYSTKGKIAGWTIEKDKLYNENVGIQTGSGSTIAFWAGSGSGANAPFWVDHDGRMKASSGTIAGWTLSDNSISANGTSFNSDGSITGNGFNFNPTTQQTIMNNLTTQLAEVKQQLNAEAINIKGEAASTQRYVNDKFNGMYNNTKNILTWFEPKGVELEIYPVLSGDVLKGLYGKVTFKYGYTLSNFTFSNGLLKEIQDTYDNSNASITTSFNYMI